jgi:hypothetical protein
MNKDNDFIIDYNKCKTTVHPIYKDIVSFPRFIQLIFVFFILIIFIYFWGKAASLGIKHSCLDFATPYFATKAWVNGANPYDDIYIGQLWQQETGDVCYSLLKSGRKSVYPITTFPILFPFTLLNFNHAKTFWILLNFIFLILQIFVIIDLVNLKYSQLGALLIAFAVLLFHPIRAAFIQANPGFFSISCIIFSLWASIKDRKILSALLIALGCAIKPHIGLPFLLLYAIHKQWRIIIISILLLLIIFSLSIFFIGHNNILAYLTLWINNINSSISKGGINDPSFNNPLNFQLINLQYPLWAIFHNNLITNSIAFAIAGLELFIFVLLLIKYEVKSCDIIQISTLSAIILLPIYHRIFDASILIPNIALAVGFYYSKYKIYSIITIIILTPFIIINSANYLIDSIRYGIISYQFSQSLLWKAFLLPHQSWLIFLLSVNSLCLMNRFYKENYS